MRHWEALAISIICMIKGSHTRTGYLNCLHSEHSQENTNIMTKSLHSQTLYHLKSMEEDDICELLKKDAGKQPEDIALDLSMQAVKKGKGRDNVSVIIAAVSNT